MSRVEGFMSIAAITWSVVLIGLGVLAYRNKVVIINHSVHKLNLLFATILSGLNIIRLAGTGTAVTNVVICLGLLIIAYLVTSSIKDYTISVFNSDCDKIFNIIECMLFMYGVKYKKDKFGISIIDTNLNIDIINKKDFKPKATVKYTGEVIVFKGYRHIKDFRQLSAQLKEELKHKGYVKLNSMSLFYIGFGVLCIPMALVFLFAR